MPNARLNPTTIKHEPKMKKYVIILAAALLAGSLTGCEDDATLPFIPVEKPDDNTPPSGDDPATHTVTYRLDKVLLCAPENTEGTDLIGKFDFFAATRMTLRVSPTKTTVVFENGDIPFYPFAEKLPEGEIPCELNTNVTPNVLRIKDTETVLATFENDGFTMSFRLDCKSLTYKYKFKSIN